MKKFRKHLMGVIAAGIVLAGAGGVYAYWTQSGSGSATGTTGTTGTVTLSGSFAPGLYPGGTRPVSFTAGNSGTSAVQVGTLHLVSVSAPTGCVVADFTMPDVAENHSVPAGATAEPLPNNGTLSMANTAANQDACKSAQIVLTLSSN